MIREFCAENLYPLRKHYFIVASISGEYFGASSFFVARFDKSNRGLPAIAGSATRQTLPLDDWSSFEIEFNHTYVYLYKLRNT